MTPPDVEPPRTLSAVRAHLDRGFRFERAGTVTRALDAYNDALAAGVTPIEMAEARMLIARVRRSMAEWDDAIAESRAAVDLAAKAGADDLVVEAMNIEIGVHELRGDFEAAEALAARANERPQSSRVRGITLCNQGAVAARRRDFIAADRYFTESIVAFRTAGYELGVAMALINASAAARDRGDPQRALELGREAAALCRTLNFLDVLLTAVQNQAAALVALGNLDDAEQLLAEALGYFTSARNLIRQAECLELMGEVSELRPDDRVTSKRFFSRASDLAQAAGDRVLTERLRKRLDSDTPGGGARLLRAR